MLMPDSAVILERDQAQRLFMGLRHSGITDVAMMTQTIPEVLNRLGWFPGQKVLSCSLSASLESSGSDSPPQVALTLIDEGEATDREVLLWALGEAQRGGWKNADQYIRFVDNWLGKQANAILFNHAFAKAFFSRHGEEKWIEQLCAMVKMEEPIDFFRKFLPKAK